MKIEGYMTFSVICNLEELTLLAENQSQSLDFGHSELTDLIKNCIDGHKKFFLALNYERLILSTDFRTYCFHLLYVC